MIFSLFMIFSFNIFQKKSPPEHPRGFYQVLFFYDVLIDLTGVPPNDWSGGDSVYYFVEVLT